MAISIRERIRKKDISSGILLFEETASLLFPFFVLFRKETRAAKVARQARSVLLFVRCKKKKGERKGMREKVTSSRVSRIVQILENKILSLLYATTIIFMQLEI